MIGNKNDDALCMEENKINKNILLYLFIIKMHKLLLDFYNKI
jgi:hypothetical protein